MPSAQGALSGYAAVTVLRSPRTAEYDAFARVTARLGSAAEAGPSGFARLVAALHANRRLWALVASEVADPRNALPAELRAGLFYLAEFTEVHSRRVLAREADAAALVEVNTAVMRGLAGGENAP
ncbi:MAG: flagellar biosynthesis regulator FlhF [Alphaproteobacteria bacterium HGW-Alphaproteobacteria-2]|nr:MAG: flagellar biosynthesis regulator FlhF [Alphaproteobacteria bacterium HGW-Alphaproteobacteria-2]